jgi:hypothetical protein
MGTNSIPVSIDGTINRIILDLAAFKCLNLFLQFLLDFLLIAEPLAELVMLSA